MLILYNLGSFKLQRDYKLFNEEELRIDTLKAVWQCWINDSAFDH